jgi:hypothetical protein
MMSFEECMKELKQEINQKKEYCKIGTIEECREAVQTMKKLKEWIDEHRGNGLTPLGDEWVYNSAICEFLEKFIEVQDANTT